MDAHTARRGAKRALSDMPGWRELELWLQLLPVTNTAAQEAGRDN